MTGKSPFPFVCPHCGFRIFNRRVPNCESCAKPLPAELLLDPKQLQFLAEEEKKIEAIRKRLARQAEEERRKREARRGDGG